MNHNQAGQFELHNPNAIMEQAESGTSSRSDNDDVLEPYLRCLQEPGKFPPGAKASEINYLETNRHWLSKLCHQQPDQADFTCSDVLQALGKLPGAHNMPNEELIFLIRTGAGLAEALCGAHDYRGGPLPLKIERNLSIDLINSSLLNRSLCWYFMALAALRDTARAQMPNAPKISDLASDGVYVMKDTGYRFYNFLKSNQRIRGNMDSGHFNERQDRRIKSVNCVLVSLHKQKQNRVGDAGLPGNANRMHYGSLPNDLLFFTFRHAPARNWLTRLTCAARGPEKESAKSRLPQLHRGMLRRLFDAAKATLDTATQARIMPKSRAERWLGAIREAGFPALDDLVREMESALPHPPGDEDRHDALRQKLAELKEELDRKKASFALPFTDTLAIRDDIPRRGAEIHLDPDPRLYPASLTARLALHPKGQTDIPDQHGFHAGASTPGSEGAGESDADSDEAEALCDERIAWAGMSACESASRRSSENVTPDFESQDTYRESSCHSAAGQVSAGTIIPRYQALFPHYCFNMPRALISEAAARNIPRAPMTMHYTPRQIRSLR